MEPPEIWAKEPDFEGLKIAYAKLELEHQASEAIKLLHELRSHGSIVALLYLGSAYERGIGTTANFACAEKYYKLAIDAGAIGGLLGLGSIFMKQANYVDAEKAFLAGTDRGDMRSIHWPARMYLKQKHDS